MQELGWGNIRIAATLVGAPRQASDVSNYHLTPRTYLNRLCAGGICVSVIVGFKQVAPDLIERIRKDPSLTQSVLFPDAEDTDRGIDLDVAWDAIHFLLTGRRDGGSPPMANAIKGGHPIGPDLGMGPARYLAPEEVKAVADALAQVTKDILRRQFNPVAMKKAKVYNAEAWSRGDEAFEELFGHFEFLQRYYRNAAERGDAILIYMA